MIFKNRLHYKLVITFATLCCSLFFYVPTFAQEDTITLEIPIKENPVDLTVNLDSVEEPKEAPWFANTPDALAIDRLQCIEKDIKLTYNKTIKGFIKYFAVRKPHYCLVMERRKDLYFPIFEKILKENGIPEEMKYLAIVESGLNPRAVSRVGAVGLWQFMPATGKQFGLTINEFIDERMDPYKSTVAACKYLGMAYSIFKDWELSIASYNCGMGHVRRSIRRSGYADTFWEVYDFLPQETRSYVPQYVAVNYVMNYLGEHDIHADSIEASIDFDTIRFRHQFVNVDALCQQLDVCIEDFYKLNPALQKSYLPPSISYPLRIPRDKMNLYYTNRDAIADACSQASDFSSSPMPAYIAVLGNSKPSGVQNAVNTSAVNSKKVYHTVRKGQSIYKISNQYHVSVAALKSWNKLRNNNLVAGQKLVIYKKLTTVAPVATARIVKPKQLLLAKAKKKQIHYVQPGDTLWNIAQKYEGVSVERIKKLNRLKTNELKIGQKLILG